MNRISSNATGRLTLLFVAASVFTSSAQSLPPNVTPTDKAKAEGTALALEILTRRPDANASLTGVLKIRAGDGRRTEVPVHFGTVVTKTHWLAVYEVIGGTNLAKPAPANHSSQPDVVKLSVMRNGPVSNQYEARLRSGGSVSWTTGEALHSGSDKIPVGEETTLRFAGSDFWAADLGLEFFHWPEQRLIKKELRRSRSCRVLESVNPQPVTSGYSRVDSWIDRETLGIIHAEAFDANGRLLKEFDPKSFKEVNGRWELQEMEIRNVQTGSRSRIEFNTNPP